MIQVSALEFQRNFGKYQDEAQKEPVEITRHGRPAFVLLTAEHYQWLQAAMDRRVPTIETPDAIFEAVERVREEAERQDREER